MRPVRPVRPVREVVEDRLAPGDGTVAVVGWADPPRRRAIWADSPVDWEPGQAVHVGNGFIRVMAAGARPTVTLQLFDHEPPWNQGGWQSLVSGAELFAALRVSCATSDGRPRETGLDLPDENMAFRVYTGDPARDVDGRTRWLVQFWPVNDLVPPAAPGQPVPGVDVPTARALSVPRPSAADLDAVWARLLTWADANVPASRASIRPPAPAADLAAARTAFDRPWPEDLVRLYQLCDGTADASRWGLNVFPLTPIVPLDHLLRSRETNLEVQQEFPPDPDDPPEDDSATADPHDVWMWSPRFVPFAEDVSGDGYFVDLRDGPAYGSVGRWRHADNRTAAIWPSLTAALEQVAEALENGLPFEGWTPVVTGAGELDWEI